MISAFSVFLTVPPTIWPRIVAHALRKILGKVYFNAILYLVLTAPANIWSPLHLEAKSYPKIITQRSLNIDHFLFGIDFFIKMISPQL